MSDRELTLVAVALGALALYWARSAELERMSFELHERHRAERYAPCAACNGMGRLDRAAVVVLE